MQRLFPLKRVFIHLFSKYGGTMSKKIFTLLASVTMLASSQQAFSTGFFLIEQSVSAMGTAYGSGASGGEDASTIWFNPAGMTRICGAQFVGGVHAVIPVADYDDQGSQAVTGFAGIQQGPATTFQDLDAYQNHGDDDGRDGGEFAAVANSYFSKQINDCLWVGLGITSPYGLVTDYKDNWRGRYHAIRSSVLTINLNPSVAWKINNQFSVGAGFNAMYMHAKLTNAVDFGLITQFASGNAGAFGMAPQENDGKVELKGNSWAYGWNVGALWEPCYGTRIGASYRSEVKHKLTGKEKFKDVPVQIRTIPQLAGLNAQFQDTGANATVKLPMQASISAYRDINCCWAIMGDISWTNWDVLQELRFTFENENQSDGVTTFDWRDTFRYSLGTTYRMNRCLILRAGVAYDQSPVKNAELRTPRVPDEDRIWTTLGFGYNINECLRVDVGYAHIFVDKPRLDSLKTLVYNAENWFRGGLKGKYDAYTDIISAQVVWGF